MLQKQPEEFYRLPRLLETLPGEEVGGGGAASVGREARETRLFLLFKTAAAFKIYLPPQHMQRRRFPGGTGHLQDGQIHIQTHTSLLLERFTFCFLKREQKEKEREATRFRRW